MRAGVIPDRILMCIGRSRLRQARRIVMLDLAYLALGAGTLLILALYARALSRI
jgi:hypothetical protein